MSCFKFIHVCSYIYFWNIYFSFLFKLFIFLGIVVVMCLIQWTILFGIENRMRLVYFKMGPRTFHPFFSSSHLLHLSLFFPFSFSVRISTIYLFFFCRWSECWGWLTRTFWYGTKKKINAIHSNKRRQRRKKKKMAFNIS